MSLIGNPPKLVPVTHACGGVYTSSIGNPDEQSHHLSHLSPNSNLVLFTLNLAFAGYLLLTRNLEQTIPSTTQ